jgi:hypothetical protein
MKLRIPALVASLALGGTLALAATGVASANPTPNGPAGRGVCAAQARSATASQSIDSLKAFGDCEISRRLTTLSKLSSRVSSSNVLTSSDKAALSSEISAAVSGLNSLKATIDSDSTVADLRSDVTKIATQFRVYLLVVPQVNLVAAADGVLAAQPHFASIGTDLAARIAAAQAAGKDVTAAQAALDAMNTQVANAVSLATGLPAKLLPLTPADYNAGSAGPVIRSARTALGQARVDLRAAVAAAQTCRTALRAIGY